MIPPDDELLKRLAQLPSQDVDTLTAERIRRRTSAVFVEESARPQWMRAASRVWNGVVEPAFVILVVLTYLHWGVSTSGALLSSDRPVSKPEKTTAVY